MEYEVMVPNPPGFEEMPARPFASPPQMDDTYGRAVNPKYFSNIERHKPPDSLQRLDAESARLLSDYVLSAVQGLKVPRVNHVSVVMLWVMDESGDIWFAVEEMYKANADNTVFPRLDGVRYPDGYEKLGHPSLIGAGKGRIGGEIMWDPFLNGGGGWVISNKSGRYGLREDIVREHIDNVAEKFRQFGISLSAYYIGYNP